MENSLTDHQDSGQELTQSFRQEILRMEWKAPEVHEFQVRRRGEELATMLGCKSTVKRRKDLALKANMQSIKST